MSHLKWGFCKSNFMDFETFLGINAGKLQTCTNCTPNTNRASASAQNLLPCKKERILDQTKICKDGRQVKMKSF